MANIGKVGTVHGRWVWPFRRMQIGDEFFVHYEDRAPEDVRQLASVRAAQLGIRLSCRKDDEAGVIWVKRIDWDKDEDVLPKALSYEQFKALAKRLYDVDADVLRWGDPQIFEARKIGSDPRRRLTVMVADEEIEVELDEEAIILRAPPSAEIHRERRAQWIKTRPLTPADTALRALWPKPIDEIDEETRRLMS